MIEISVKKQLGAVSIQAEFSIDTPGITVIFGASGAGKTSVINMVAGLVQPDEGRIRLHGTTLFDSQARVNVAKHLRRIGYVFQDGRLFPHLNVEQNLVYGSRHHASSRSVTPNTSISLSEVSELLGISHLFERRPAQLSGGEKQRVAIGRALLARPRLLLMDEPLASLDGPRKNELLPYIASLSGKFGVPVIYVTHSMNEILRLADQVLYMHDGAAIDFGRTEDVLNGSALQRYLPSEESGSVLHATVVSSEPDVSFCKLDGSSTVLNVSRGGLAVGTELRFRIAAEDVIISRCLPSCTSVQNIIETQIVGFQETHLGLVEMDLDIGHGLKARVSSKAWEALELKVGRTVYALIKSAAITRNSVVLGSR